LEARLSEISQTEVRNVGRHPLERLTRKIFSSCFLKIN
jgi:hypothetical protein